LDGAAARAIRRARGAALAPQAPAVQSGGAASCRRHPRSYRLYVLHSRASLYATSRSPVQPPSTRSSWLAMASSRTTPSTARARAAIVWSQWSRLATLPEMPRAGRSAGAV
jgi:hypothetical protein